MTARTPDTHPAKRHSANLALALLVCLGLFVSSLAAVPGAEAGGSTGPRAGIAARAQLSKRCRAIQWSLQDASKRRYAALAAGNQTDYDDWLWFGLEVLELSVDNNCNLDLDGGLVPE
jgi:hypothetical protein